MRHFFDQMILVTIFSMDLPKATGLKIYSHIGVQLELISLVTDSKVALGDPVLASLKGHLVASQPSLVAHNHSPMDSGAVDVIIHITPQIDVLSFIASLDLSTLLAEIGTMQGKIQRLLQPRYV